MLAKTVADLGGLDILLAAAGVSHAGYGTGEVKHKFLHEISFADWRKLMAINLDGCFLTCQAAAKQMIAQGRGGRIIAIASGAAKIPIKGSGEYAVSKAGVWMLMKNMALELGRYDITCNAIGPGVIDTPTTQELQQGKNFDRMMR
jgi:glucose 1-dehydrogenase